jgi:hypothetical protein
MMSARAYINSDAAAVDVFHNVCVGVVGEGEISQLVRASIDQLVRLATRRSPKEVARLNRQSLFAEPIGAAARKDEEQLVRGVMAMERCRALARWDGIKSRPEAEEPELHTELAACGGEALTV